MTWAKLDDRLHDDDRTLAAGVDAMGLWAIALSYMGDRLTDGEISVERVRRIAGRRGEGLSTRLVEVGWWERTPTGFRLISWEKYLISRSEVEDNRAHKSELGRRGGMAKAAKEKESGLATRQAPASAEFLLPIPSRSRPDPVPEEQQKEDPPTPDPERRPEGFKLTPPNPSPASPAKTKKPPKSDATDDERKVFEGFLRGREYRHVKGGAAPLLDAKRLKLIRERLADGHTPETLAAAAFGIWVSQWHFDEGQSRFDLALRDGDHVERFARVTHEREQDLARFRPAPGQEEPDEDDEDDGFDEPPESKPPPGYVEPTQEQVIARLEGAGLRHGAQALREKFAKEAADAR